MKLIYAVLMILLTFCNNSKSKKKEEKQLKYLDQKKEACGDFSVSSEMGFENAFEALRRFCQ